jgi:hypothetical protein
VASQETVSCMKLVGYVVSVTYSGSMVTNKIGLKVGCSDIRNFKFLFQHSPGGREGGREREREREREKP